MGRALHPSVSQTPPRGLWPRRSPRPVPALSSASDSLLLSSPAPVDVRAAAGRAHHLCLQHTRPRRTVALGCRRLTPRPGTSSRGGGVVAGVVCRAFADNRRYVSHGLGNSSVTSWAWVCRTSAAWEGLSLEHVESSFGRVSFTCSGVEI